MYEKLVALYIKITHYVQSLNSEIINCDQVNTARIKVLLAKRDENLYFLNSLEEIILKYERVNDEETNLL